MPAASAITINDGAASPVAHTFTPIGKDDKGVLWFEQTTPTPTSPIGAKRIGYRQSRNAGGQSNGSSKLVISMAVPALETLGNNSNGFLSAPTVAYKVVMRMEVDMPERSLNQERKDTRVLFQNLLGQSVISGAIDALVPIY